MAPYAGTPHFLDGHVGDGLPAFGGAFLHPPPQVVGDADGTGGLPVPLVGFHLPEVRPGVYAFYRIEPDGRVVEVGRDEV